MPNNLLSNNLASNNPQPKDPALAATRSAATYHTEARYEQMEKFVQSAFNGQGFRLKPLPGDASFRRYYRVSLDTPLQNSSFDASYIVMDAPPQVESIEKFIRIDLLMATRVNVPTLRAKDLKQGFLLLQDFGNVEFADILTTAKAEQDWATIDDLYRLAMHDLINLQGIDVNLARYSFGVPDYDAALLQQEMALFSEWFLPHINVAMSSDDTTLWQQFGQQLTQSLLTQPKVVVHRDYHSRNLMQDQYQQETLGIIDFQDAVIGPYTYDLVSLLRDAYVNWPEQQVEQWLTYFWQQLKLKPALLQTKSQANPVQMPSFMQFKEHVNLMGVQRHLKVLGIFIRLATRDGKSRYLQDVPKVWGDLMLEMSWLNEHASADVQQSIAPFYHWLNQKILPQVEQVLFRAVL